MRKSGLIFFSLVLVVIVMGFIGVVSALSIVIKSVNLEEPKDGAISGKATISVKAIISNDGTEDDPSPFYVNTYVNDKPYSYCSGKCELNYGIPVSGGLKAGQSGEIWWASWAGDREFLKLGENEIEFVLGFDGSRETQEKSVKFTIQEANSPKIDLGISNAVISVNNGKIESIQSKIVNNGPSIFKNDVLAINFCFTNLNTGQKYGCYGSQADFRADSCDSTKENGCSIEVGKTYTYSYESELSRLNSRLVSGDYEVSFSVDDINGLKNYEEINKDNNNFLVKFNLNKSELGDKTTEKITCKFEDTQKEQKCYLAGQFSDGDLGTKYCIASAGVGSCVIVYTSYKGEQVIWKSSCGQYQYTTQDENDEVIYFKCNEGETNISEIKNNGFRKVYFQCYDGAESKSTDREACKSADYWKKFAENFCQSHCDKKTGKCGVNTFSIGQECYLGEGLCREGETGDECCNRWASENNIVKPACVGGWNIEDDKCSWSCKDYGECKIDSDCPVASCAEGSVCPGYKCIDGKCVSETIVEPVLICKDSCPLDGKCYPFGYRKSGKFCSDSGGFIAQLKGDKTCENNFECSSNVCVAGKCISEGFIEKIMNWFKRLFGGE